MMIVSLNVSTLSLSLAFVLTSQPPPPPRLLSGRHLPPQSSQPKENQKAQPKISEHGVPTISS